MTRRPGQRIEVICPTCGLIAELYRSRKAARPRFCECPIEQSVQNATRPRLCIHCSTRLNRYNTGSACGPCLHAQNRGILRPR